MTYESNEAYFPGDPADWQPQRDTSDLYVDAEVSLVGEELDVTFSSY